MILYYCMFESHGKSRLDSPPAHQHGAASFASLVDFAEPGEAFLRKIKDRILNRSNSIGKPESITRNGREPACRTFT